MAHSKQSNGSGARSAELAFSGFVHDVCSAIHALTVASPFFRSLNLERFDLEWAHPQCPLAHPFDGGQAALLERSVERTAAQLDEDGLAYPRLVSPLVERWDDLERETLAPPLHLSRHPFLLARFGARAIQPAAMLTRQWFRGARARGLFAGLAAHSFLPLDRAPSSAIGLVLALSRHAVGWPMSRGGSQKLADALVACVRGLEGMITTGQDAQNLEELPHAQITFLDLTPRQVLRVAGPQLGRRYRKQLERFRCGPGIFAHILQGIGGPFCSVAPALRSRAWRQI
jgi:phytoene dehydrogenase-like protein